MSPSTFAQLRNDAIAMKHGVQLSKPATRVDAPHDLNTMRFSRTLDERNPYTRSGSAWIVPMEDDLQAEFNASTYVIAFILVIAVFVVVGFS